MRIEKTTGMCLGSVRLAAIDMGFDARECGLSIALPSDPEAVRRMATEGEGETGVGFDGSDGKRYIMWGTPDEIRRTLRKNGYKIA